MKLTLLILLLFANLAFADAREINDYHWEGVERIVAIGDLHGDYENYIKALRAAGLVNKKGKWSGGSTHLVQTGDIPDRGADTLKIIDHISKLGKQAQRKGGRVHNLIGNHEAMNVYGDLRYVHAGEFEAFVTRGSESLRDRYYDVVMQSFEAQDPEGFAALPENYREEWNSKIPLGWVEHRQAWDPAWNPQGEYANWVLDKKIAIRINNTIFLHGGISGYYCQNSLESMTQKARASLRNFDPLNPGLIDDENGPLWYRGLSGVEPQALPETVDAILEHHGANHIVVGHTPTNGVIWPLFEAKVVVIDSGISSAYGGHIAYLEIKPDGLFAGYPNHKLPLPADAEGLVPYLEQVIKADPDNPYLQQRLKNLLNPPLPEPADETVSGVDNKPSGDATSSGNVEVAGQEPAPQPMPICGISQ
jgi:hypothetical protein